jgi:hypothetical protein
VGDRSDGKETGWQVSGGGVTMSVKPSTNVAFLSTSYEQPETKIKSTIPFITKSKGIKCLGLSLKSGKVCTLRATKCFWNKYTNKWKDILCSWIERCSIVKMSVHPKAITRFNEIFIKSPTMFCQKQKKILNFNADIKTDNQWNRVEKQALTHMVK